MEYKDYYKALGVPRTASQDDIKKAFRKLARKYHPDVNAGDAAAEKRFKEISEADEVLSDPEKRKAYDALGANWEAYQRAGAPGRGGAGAGFDPFAGRPGFAGGTRPGGMRFEYTGNAEDLAGFSEFFQRFFGGARAAAGNAAAQGRERVRQRTRDRAEDAEFDDLLSQLGGLDIDGNGRAPGSRAGGGVAGGRQHAEGSAEITLEEAAAGTERLVGIDDKRLEVKIPAGVDTGRRIRLSGKAGAGPDAGDVYLTVTVKPHAVFTRNGDDLHRELPVTLGEALLGAEVPVETLGGGRVLLRIPPETQTGRTIRLAGKGMPRFRADGRGDLYVKVRVVLPTGLDDRAKELATAFLDHVAQPDPRTA
jgi:curved DNA-binding protein